MESTENSQVNITDNYINMTVVKKTKYKNMHLKYGIHFSIDSLKPLNPDELKKALIAVSESIISPESEVK